VRVLELTEQVVAALVIAVRQGVELRGRVQTLALSAPLAEHLERLGEAVPLIGEDRALESDLRHVLSLIDREAWRLYA
jgi:histidine ammonia-lyase